MIADGAHAVGGRLYVLGGGIAAVIVGQPHAVFGILEVDYLEATRPHDVCLQLLDSEHEPVIAVPSPESPEEGQPIKMGPIKIDTGIPAGHPVGVNLPLSFAMSFPPCVPPTFTVGER